MGLGILIFSALFSVGVFTVAVNGQCDQRNITGKVKCCRGRDSQCYVFNNRAEKKSNVSLVNAPRKVCYCDEYCKLTKDCCADYDRVKEFCGVDRVDCQISAWTEWTACSSDCGFGTMKRKRYILQLPKNAGKICPPVRQVRGCFISKCHLKSETALILPEIYRRLPFGSWGYEQILPAPEEVPPTKRSSTGSYCIHFQPRMKRSTCGHTWADTMRPDKPACVECQARVMDRFGRCRGDGKIGQKTRWDAVGLKRCFGEWMRVGPAIPNCTCTKRSFSNFVFV